MHRDPTHHHRLPIGFARSLLWAVASTMGTFILLAQTIAPRIPRTLPSCLFGAVVVYPFITWQRLREALRPAFLVALLLLSTLETSQPALVSLLAAAVAVGLLRTWSCWQGDGAIRAQWLRESCSLGASLALGGFMLGPHPLDLAFTVWGFCLGQMVSTLFDAPFETASPISVGASSHEIQGF
jgi:hypothetical protein